MTVGFPLLVDTIVVIGAAVVLPLALGPRRRWAVVAVCAAVALMSPRGSAGAVAAAAVWPLVAAWNLSERVRPLTAALRAGWWAHLDEVGGAVAAAYAVVAGGALVWSRSGVALLGIHEPIIELTAVHFTYAGVGASAAASGAVRALAGRARVLAGAALVLVAAAPAAVAGGFTTGLAGLQVGGAAAMTAGMWCLAGALFAQGRVLGREPHGAGRWAGRVLRCAAAVPVVTMPLAVAWAAGQYWDVPALDVPAMARTHGVANTVLVVAALAAQRAGARSRGREAGGTMEGAPVRAAAEGGAA